MGKFWWGNSVSSMQTEGGWNEDGKSLSVYDIVEPGEHRSDWHFANDNYHHFEEDLDLMQELGMNMYRIQISWSRCVKDGCGAFNDAGIAYYDRLINAMIARGLEPMVCLYHFDMPLYLAEKYNGFLSREVSEYFIRFGKGIIDHFSDRVKYWLTFNEQNLYHNPEIAFRIAGYRNGEKTCDELYQILHNVMYAHVSLCNYVHETSGAKIGGMLAYSLVYPLTCTPADIFAAGKWDEFINQTLLEVFAHGHYSEEMMQWVRTHGIDMKAQESDFELFRNHHEDFIAFSYYSSSAISAEHIPDNCTPNWYMHYGKAVNPNLKATEWGWQIDPLGFRQVLCTIYRRYHMPVFPIENGIGVQEEWDGEHMIEDDYRIEYHRAHIQAMKDAMETDGVPVMGYLGWGLIDILSSQGDMRKRYGVVYVNRTNHDLKDMKRVRKKSFAWLQKVIRSDGKDLD